MPGVAGPALHQRSRWSSSTPVRSGDPPQPSSVPEDSPRRAWLELARNPDRPDLERQGFGRRTSSLRNFYGEVKRHPERPFAGILRDLRKRADEGPGPGGGQLGGLRLLGDPLASAASNRWHAMTAAVDQRAVLRIQLQSLVEQLNHVDRALADEHVDVQLRERVAVRFQALVRQRRAAALALRDQLDAGASLDTAWDELEAIRADSLPVFSESLALLEGALARTICLDLGLCAIADALLREVSRLCERPWDRFTILADGEYFGNVAEIVRIRFRT